jgi:hypothetical protein
MSVLEHWHPVLANRDLKAPPVAVRLAGENLVLFRTAGGMRLFGWILRRQLDWEIQLDVRILEGLADKSTAIDGMKLSRFDRVLGFNRERIERIYRRKA